MRVPAALLGASTMACLVAVSSVMVFVISMAHAKESIDDVSSRLAKSRMDRAVIEIRFQLQRVPVDTIIATKQDVEAGYLSFNDSVGYWGLKAMHFFDHSGFFTLYIVLPGNRALGEAHGMGFIIDAAGRSVLHNDPPYLHLQGYIPENGTVVPGIVVSAPLDLTALPFVTMFTTGTDHSKHQLANTPRWTDIIVSMNPSMEGGGGPLITITTPVFRTPVPRNEDFIGVMGAGIYLALFSLEPYLLSENSHLLLLDDLGMLVSSTDVGRTFYENGTLATGEPNYMRHTLLTTNITLYPTLHRALPDLASFEEGTEHFSKFTHDGDVMWLEVRAVYHYNLRWYLIGVIPEKEFFQKIYDSNRETLVIVIVLIVSSCVVAAVVTFLFTMSLTRLAIAFKHVANMQLGHEAVVAVGHSHCLFELNALYIGFWHAVDMVKQVQAFLPDVVVSDGDTATETLTATSGTSLSSSKGGTSGTGGGGTPNGSAKNIFSLGLRSTNSATCLVVHMNQFSEICRTNLDEAVTTHKRVFAMIAEQTKLNKGVVSYLEGSKVVVTWNTSRCCPATTSKSCSTELGLELYGLVNEMTTIDIGISKGFTYHGILGGTQQRFSVMGSELPGVAMGLARHAAKLELEPSIFASKGVVEGLHGVTFHLVDKATGETGEKLSVYWVADKVQVEEAEWMYQLRSQEAKPLLDGYWAAVAAGDTEHALHELQEFEKANLNTSVLVAKLRNDATACVPD